MTAQGLHPLHGAASSYVMYVCMIGSCLLNVCHYLLPLLRALQVAFDYWHGDAKGRDSDATFAVEGVDMLLFDGQGQITTLVQFDMQDYSRQLQGNAGAPAGSGEQ